MNDHARMMLPWTPELEQCHRALHDGEILEPLPAWCSVPVEPLTLGEVFTAARWAVALSLVLVSISNAFIEDPVTLILMTCAISWGVGRLLGPRAIARAYQRKRNSLEA